MKIKRKIKISDLVLLIIILILIVTYLLIKLFTYRSEPILLDYAKRKSTNIISSVINNSINEVLYNIKYEEIINIQKDNEGNISSLNFNNKEINKILYYTTDNILKNISLLEKGKYSELDNNIISKDDSIYYIPIGIIHDVPILVNLGPKIPFIIEFLGSVNNETSTSIKEYGINSSIVEVFLNVNLQVQIILPFKSQTYEIDKHILLDSKIIQGQIPNYYGGLISNSLPNN